MKIRGVPTRTIWPAADGDGVHIIDQTRLPHDLITLRLDSLEDAERAIRDMQVRGAPLIGATAAYGVALAMRGDASDRALADACRRLLATRPTAVNLRWALDDMAACLKPLAAVQRFAHARCRAVVFDQDLTEHGLACINIFPDSHLPALFEHLAGSGNVRLGCFNVQPEDPVIRRRIQAWRAWLQDRRRTGQLVDEPVPLYDHAIVRAHEVMSRLLRGGGLECDAFFVTTTDAAKGVIRALWDHGVAIGRDFRVASIGDEGNVRYMTPSLTAIEPPDLARLARQTLSWIQSSDRSAPRALKVGEETPRLFIGETTRTVKLPEVKLTRKPARRQSAAVPAEHRRPLCA